MAQYRSQVSKHDVFSKEYSFPKQGLALVFSLQIIFWQWWKKKKKKKKKKNQKWMGSVWNLGCQWHVVPDSIESYT